MSFPTKDWKDFPNTSTPINAAALEDVENRLSTYTDDEVSALNVSQYATDTDLSSHASDTTAIHGIADTGALMTSADIDAVVVLTQSAYDALTPNARTLYVVSG